jgi:hypothetical protein
MAGGGKVTPISVEAEERDRIARTVAVIRTVTGIRPVGWHTRSPGSANTRRILVAEGNAWIARRIDIAKHWRTQFPET